MKLFGNDFITQKYLRLYPHSARTKSWSGVPVHIQTENGVWRVDGHGYTFAGREDAWILPFEEAVKTISHCGPEKMGKFLRADTDKPNDNFHNVSRPVYHIEIPLTVNGYGPASPEDSVSIGHEVWDQLCRTLCSCSDAEDAKLIASAVNEYRK